MARNISTDDTGRIYRAVITYQSEGFSGTFYRGPYETVGTAKAQVTRAQNQWGGLNRTITGQVQSAAIDWQDIDE